MALSPRYADAHYNLALAYERKGKPGAALRHWQAYVRLDARPLGRPRPHQIRKLLNGEPLTIASRAGKFIPPSKVLPAFESANPRS